MEILINGSTTPTQLRLIAKLLTSLAGDAAASIELTPEPADFFQPPIQLDIVDKLAEFDGAGLPAGVSLTGYPPLPPSQPGDIVRGPFVPAPPVPVIAAIVTAPATTATTLNTGGASGATAPALTPTHDKTGRVWDARIDSSSKAMNADGTWRARRGVDAATYQGVLRELGVVTVPVVTAPPAPVVTSIPVPPVLTSAQSLQLDATVRQMTAAGASVMNPFVPAPPVPVAADAVVTVPGLAPVAAAPSPPVTFAGLMQIAMPLTREGKLTSDWLNTCVAEIGAPSPQHMIGNPDLLSAAQKWIQARA